MNQNEDDDNVWFQRATTPRNDGTVADDESGSSPGRYSESDADTPQTQPPFYQASIILVGSTKAGKTCLARALTRQDFIETYRETSIAHNRLECLYVDPVTLSMLNKNKNKKKKSVEQQNQVLLELIDISGAKDHIAERQIHSRDADAIIFVYNISDPQSLEDIKDVFYYEACRIKCQDPLEIPHLLVGTKLDLSSEAQGTESDGTPTDWISEDKARLYGSNFNCWSTQTSAKTGVGIENLRNYLLSLVVSNTPRGGYRKDPESSSSSSSGTIVSKLKKIKCILQ